MMAIEGLKVWGLILLHVLTHYCCVKAGIVQPPTSQLILPGMNATFNCVTTEGTSSWTVNGMPVNVGNEWQYRGVTFTIDENIDPASGYILTVLTLRVEGRAINNGSQVQCYSAYANVDVSNPVSLIIAGAPLAPSLALTVLNSTLIKLSWGKPFTWIEVADILNYTVSMYNSSSQEWKNWTVGPSVNAFLISGKQSVDNECVELLFNVSATNVVGESRTSPISGGFPTATKWSDELNGTRRLLVTIYRNKDGRVLTTMKIQPPTMCSYQTARYDVIISDFLAGVQLAKTSVEHTYGDGSPFEIVLEFVPIFKEERTYYVILSVSSFNFASLQAIASFNVSPTIMPTTFNYTSGLIIGATVGASTIALFTILLAIAVALWCRLHNGKRHESESVTDHHYQEAPVVPSRSFEQSARLEPLYERIDDCQQKLTTITQTCPEALIKEQGHSIAETKCTTTECVRHTPDGDYIEMKIVVDSAEDNRCVEMYTPPLPGGTFQETV